MFIKSKSLVPVFLALVQLATLAVAVKPPTPAPTATATTTPSRYAHRLAHHSGPPKVNTTAAHAPISPRQAHNADYGSSDGPSGNPGSDSTSNSTSTDTGPDPSPSAAAQRRRMLYGHISGAEGDSGYEAFEKRYPVTHPAHQPPSSPIDVESSENPQPKDVANSITGRGWKFEIKGEQRSQEFEKRAKHRQHQHQQSSPADVIPVDPKAQVQDKINGRALPADLLPSTTSQQ